MLTKHIFVPALDIGDLVPFVIRETDNIHDSMAEQERARKELEKFITRLQKNLGEKIFYMGMDIIAEKSYERFIFQSSGFFEIMVESPLAMIAHFVDKKKAEKFRTALMKTLKESMPKNEVSEMFIESIEVQDEQHQNLTYEKWDKMKTIKEV